MAKYTLTADQYEELQDIIDTDDDNELRPDYSGRGMFGATCLGYVTKDGPVRFQMALAQVLAPQLLDLDEDEEVELDEVKEAVEELGTPSTDSMGLSTIYYYRGISVEGHEQEARF